MSERRLTAVAALIDSVPDATLLVDAAGTIRAANALAERLLGVPRAELTGAPVGLLVPDCARSLDPAFAQALAASPETRPSEQRRELDVRRRDGTELSVEFSLSPLACSPEPLVWIALRDLSERRALQEAIARSERHATELLESLESGLLVVDDAGVVLATNRRTCELLRLPRERIIGAARPYPWWPPDAAAGLEQRAGAVRARATAAAGRDTGAVMEEELLRGDGTRFPARVLRRRLGSGRGHLVTVDDISGELAAKRALESERAGLAEAQAIAHIGSWWREFEPDRGGWSAELYRIFARDPALGPAIGEEFFDCVHPDDRERVRAECATAFGAGEEFERGFRIRLQDGDVRFLHLTGRRERPGRYVGTIQDVSDMRRTEAALHEAQEQFQVAIDSMLDTLTILSPIRGDAGTVVDFRFEYANDTYLELIGLDRARVLGRRVSEVFPWYETTGRFAIHRRVHETGEPHRTDEVYGDDAWAGTNLSERVLDIQSAAIGDNLVITARDVTDHRRDEQELATRAELLDLVHDAVIVTDSGEHRVTFWNRGAEALYGHSREEALGQVVYELVETTFPESRAAVEASLERDGEWVGEIRRTCRDGSVIAVSSRQSVQRDALGEPIAVIELSSDISERRRAEEALRASEQLYRGGFDSSPIGMLLADLDGTYTEVNRAFASMLGYEDPAELVGRRWTEFLHADEVPASLERFRMITHDEPIVGVRRYVARDGAIVHLLTETALIDDPEGRPSMVFAQVQDITERITAEQALRASSERFRGVFDHAPIGMAIKTGDGVIVEANARLARALGFEDPEELAGRRLAEFASPDALEQARLAAIQVKTEGASAGEQRFIRADGETVDLLVASTLVRDADGSPTILFAAGDITARKRAEEARRQAEARFRAAFEDAPIGMALSDLDGRLVSVNEAFCDIVGYPRTELEGTSLEAITHPDDVAGDRQAMADMRAGKRRSHGGETRFVHASGHPVHVALHATLMRSDAGQPLNFLAQVQDITDRRRHEQQLEYLADHDVLTGLLNRRAFNRELETHAGLVERYGAIGSVLVIDLDQFKYVNDTLGHQAGDQLIVRAAQLFAERLRTTDVLARLGGDEFGVLLPKAGPSAARRVAEHLLGTLREQTIRIGALDRTITASIGVASFEGATRGSGEDVLVNADLAMYDAKEEGRDRVATFSTLASAQSRMKGRITWAHRIQHALVSDRFTLLAQPIVALATGHVSQYELLLRMRDDHGDLIPPATFLYIAERLDLIQEIDTWVVSHGIRMLAEFDGIPPALEINLSGASLGNPTLLAHIEGELRNGGVDPRLVIFEVTETAALGSITKARAFGERLSEIGCRFAIDDFGAGFGSFYYLKHLRFDLIKIDGEFVRACRSNDTDQLLIKAIVDIARGLDKRTVAECIGDDETIELLNRIGVDYGQGFHLGIPAPLEDHLSADGPVKQRSDGHRVV